MWLKNSVDPDQLADLDLHCFLSAVSNFETYYMHSAVFRFNTVCPPTSSPEVPYIFAGFLFYKRRVKSAGETIYTVL